MKRIERSSKRIERSFFERDPVVCARELIGCTLGLGSTMGIIVETEAYAAAGDPACHTMKRPSAREFVATNPPGTAYVYLNYGMHWMLNFLVKGRERGGDPVGKREGFVLIRALEPVKGIPVMKRRRNQAKNYLLCNGPAKLTQALGITGSHHGTNPLDADGWTLLQSESSTGIDVSTRIGISVATDYPWRFLLHESPFVSVPS
jgi:DNA-3-methyladenine glycosylase